LADAAQAPSRTFAQRKRTQKRWRPQGADANKQNKKRKKCRTEKKSFG